MEQKQTSKSLNKFLFENNKNNRHLYFHLHVNAEKKIQYSSFDILYIHIKFIYTIHSISNCTK